MKQYLNYLSRYCRLALRPDVRIDEFYDAPVYIRTWHSPKVDLSTFRFGVMFRVFDWYVTLESQGVPTLDSGASPSSVDPSEELIIPYGPSENESKQRSEPS